MRFDTLVINGTVVSDTGIGPLDIGIKDGKFAALLAPGTQAKATKVIDAKGRHVFPGLIDAHIHFGFAEPVTEYTSETIYAAQGGFTTVIGFFLNNEAYGDVYAREQAHAKPRVFVDYAFHFSTASEQHITELPSYGRTTAPRRSSTS